MRINLCSLYYELEAPFYCEANMLKAKAFGVSLFSFLSAVRKSVALIVKLQCERETMR